MTSIEIVEELRAVANGAANGQKVVALNLFGIQYVDQLANQNLGDLVERARDHSVESCVVG